MPQRRTLRHAIEALESRNLMAGLATPPLAQVDPPAEITDVYQPKTNNMISNSQKAQHDVMLNVARAIY